MTHGTGQQLTLEQTAKPPAFVPAVFSPCERYRYELRREVSPGSWDGGELALFCGANPSTADAFRNDATIRKEIGFTLRWGLAGFIKLNLHGWRSTDPDEVPRSALSVGPGNRAAIELALREPRIKLVVAAWGDCLANNPCTRAEADHFVMAANAAGHGVLCFGHNKSGAPMHPLTLSYATALRPLVWP